jgi:hypothetical protein
MVYFATLSIVQIARCNNIIPGIDLLIFAISAAVTFEILSL